MVSKGIPDLDRLAREQFGFEELRPAQKEVLEAVLKGHDVLAIMPTGAGKSAIYQMAALLIEGPTVVVSPLVALQKDQVESIADKALAEAAVVNSRLRVGERRKAFEKLDSGKFEFLLLAPEQLANEETFSHLMKHRPSLFVVDEAHCISEWGHDFRPDYARLGGMVEALGHPRVLALTATASPNVREQVVERLGMRKAKMIVWGFDRPNIQLAVEACAEEFIKERRLLAHVKGEAGKEAAAPSLPCIVYCATHAGTESAAKVLQENGVNAVAYHAGLKKAERAQAQDDFMSGRVQVIVATNAFGMGIDKADVRLVVHYDIPDAIDAYYQEVGRAGRDGQPARAVLLYREEDVGRRKAMAAPPKISEGQVQQVLEAVQGESDGITAEKLAEETGASPRKLTQTLNRLEEAGAVEISPQGEVVPTEQAEAVDKVVEEVVEHQRLYREYQLARVALMQEYATTKGCRRHFILNYFGEAFAPTCGSCDNCSSGKSAKVAAREAVAEKREEHPFAEKSRVRHATFGEGLVLRYEEGNVVVLFDTQGTRSLNVETVRAKGLLRAV